MAPFAGSAAEDKVVYLTDKLNQSSSFKVRLKAAVLLGRLADPRAVRPLIRALTDDNYVVRGAAARALGNLGHPMAFEAVENLFQLVDDEEPFVQQEVRRALERLAGPQSLDHLVSALSSAKASVRLAAVQILASWNTPEAHTVLILALGDEDDAIQAEAVGAIRRLGQARLDSLLGEALDREDNHRIQQAAARLAGDLRIRSTVDRLSDLLVSDEVVPGVKTQAAIALAHMKDQLDLTRLLSQARSDDKKEQSRAIQLLGLHGGREAVDALLDLLRHADGYVRRRAVFALGDAGDPRAIPALETLVKSEREGRFQQIIQRALRKLQHARKTEVSPPQGRGGGT